MKGKKVGKGTPPSAPKSGGMKAKGGPKGGPNPLAKGLARLKKGARF